MSRDPVRVLNMTRLFSKEMFIYSFFDIKLQKPARVATFGYFFLVAGILGVLMYWVFKAPINVYTVAIVGGGGFGAAITMVKPIWNGRKFFDWVKIQIQHIMETKMYCDGWKANPMKTYFIDFSLYLSRLSDFKKLKRMR